MYTSIQVATICRYSRHYRIYLNFRCKYKPITPPPPHSWHVEDNARPTLNVIIIIIITLFIEGNKFSEITLFYHLALRKIHIKAVKTLKTF